MGKIVDTLLGVHQLSEDVIRRHHRQDPPALSAFAEVLSLTSQGPPSTDAAKRRLDHALFLLLERGRISTAQRRLLEEARNLILPPEKRTAIAPINRWSYRSLPFQRGTKPNMAQATSSVPIAANRLRISPQGDVSVSTSEGLIQFGLRMWTNQNAFSGSLQANNFTFPPKATREEVKDKLPLTYIFDSDYNPDAGFIPADFITYLKYVSNLRFDIVAEDGLQAATLRAFTEIAHRNGHPWEDMSASMLAEYPHGRMDGTRFYEEMAVLFGDTHTDELRMIHSFDPEGVFKLGQVEIRRLGDQTYEIIDNGKSLGVLDLKLHPIKKQTNPQSAKDQALEAFRDDVLKRGIPAVMPLGTSHGFDISGGETSGFLYMNQGRLLVMDPTSDTFNFLRRHHIPLSAIEGIIITHTHTDHFGEGLPELLEKLPRSKIITTPTIYKTLLIQFLLAYDGLREFDPELTHQQIKRLLGVNHPLTVTLENRYGKKIRQLSREHQVRYFVDLYLGIQEEPIANFLRESLEYYLIPMGRVTPFDWEYQPVYPQQRQTIAGMDFEFDYTLHPVPTLGIELYHDQQLIHYYSGDTYATDQIPDPNNAGEPLISLTRLLQINRHYLWALLTHGVTPHQTAQLMTHGDNPAKLPPSAFSTIETYATELAGKIANQRGHPTFFIEGGIPPIHTPPQTTRQFIDFIKEATQIDLSDTLLVYHVSDKVASDNQLSKARFVSLEEQMDHADLRPADSYLTLMGTIPVIKDLSLDKRKALLDKGRIRELKEGETIFESTEAMPSIYLVLDGEVELSHDNSHAISHVRQSIIGITSALDYENSSTAKTTSASTLLEIPLDLWKSTVRDKSVTDKLALIHLERTQLRQAFMNSPWKNLPEEIWEHIAAHGELVRFKDQEEIIRQGSSDKDLFLILNGEAFVDINGQNVANFSQGNIVGEMSPILNAPRTASVKTRGVTWALRIPQDQIRALAQHFPGVQSPLRKLATEHLTQHHNAINQHVLSSIKNKLFEGLDFSEDFYEVRGPFIEVYATEKVTREQVIQIAEVLQSKMNEMVGDGSIQALAELRLYPGREEKLPVRIAFNAGTQQYEIKDQERPRVTRRHRTPIVRGGSLTRLFNTTELQAAHQQYGDRHQGHTAGVMGSLVSGMQSGRALQITTSEMDQEPSEPTFGNLKPKLISTMPDIEDKNTHVHELVQLSPEATLLLREAREWACSKDLVTVSKWIDDFLRTPKRSQWEDIQTTLQESRDTHEIALKIWRFTAHPDELGLEEIYFPSKTTADHQMWTASQQRFAPFQRGLYIFK